MGRKRKITRFLTDTVTDLLVLAGRISLR